ncbi:MAG TPA: hypothetical protein PLQ76_02195, partial [bacterium]|nr:hypothetical protein [bacterium]
MKKLLFFIVLTSGMLFQVIPASAGPWVQDKGRLQTALTSGVSFFDSYADGGGNGTDLNSNFYQYEISYFYNRGLGNRR